MLQGAGGERSHSLTEHENGPEAEKLDSDQGQGIRSGSGDVAHELGFCCNSGPAFVPVERTGLKPPISHTYASLIRTIGPALGSIGPPKQTSA